MGRKKDSRAGDFDSQEWFISEGPQKRFVEPRILFILGRSPSHGYQILDAIARLPFPGPPPDSAAVYRTLRKLEKERLVRSRWEDGDSGPRRRVYSLTREGRERLAFWVKALKERVALLNAFIRMCEKEGKCLCPSRRS